MLENNLCILILFIIWLIIYLQLTFEWKLGVLSMLLINIYYQKQYKKTNKNIHKKAAHLTLGIAIHSSLLGWSLLMRHKY